MTPQELNELAAEEWSVAPYTSSEHAMYIMSGPHKILQNWNLEEDEMQAVTALPELFTLALAVVNGADDWQILEMARAALEKAVAAGGTPEGTHNG